MGEYKTGIWKKVGKSGAEYGSGKIKIGTNEYKVVLFANNKKTDKSPDYNLILEDALIIHEDKKQVEIVPENKSSDGLDDSVFEAFGNSIEIDPDDIAF